MIVSPVGRRLLSAGVGFERVKKISELAAPSFAIGSTIPMRASASRFIASGWVAARQSLGSLNQLLRIYLPGDLIDDAPQDMPDAQLIALTKAAVTEIPPAISETDAFRDLLKTDTREKSRHMVQHALRLGRMDAYQRTAHFLLEIDARWRAAYPDSGANIALEMKQPEIGDYLALSAVHVNRTFMALRRDGLIEVRPGLRILDNPRLLAASKLSSLDAASLRVP